MKAPFFGGSSEARAMATTAMTAMAITATARRRGCGGAAAGFAVSRAVGRSAAFGAGERLPPRSSSTTTRRASIVSSTGVVPRIRRPLRRPVPRPSSSSVDGGAPPRFRSFPSVSSRRMLPPPLSDYDDYGAYGAAVDYDYNPYADDADYGDGEGEEGGEESSTFVAAGADSGDRNAAAPSTPLTRRTTEREDDDDAFVYGFYGGGRLSGGAASNGGAVDTAADERTEPATGIKSPPPNFFDDDDDDDSGGDDDGRSEAKTPTGVESPPPKPQSPQWSAAPRRPTPSPFLEPAKTRAAARPAPTSDADVVGRDKKGKFERASALSGGFGATSRLEHLVFLIGQAESRVYELNDGAKFNANSPKQAAKALFGDEIGGSTNKDALETLASAGNELAGAIREYRRLMWEHKREAKRLEHVEKRTRGSGGGGTFNESTEEARAVDAGSKSDGDDETSNGESLLLIDASAYIYRSYYGMPPVHASDGTPVGALLGFCNLLTKLFLGKLLRGERPRAVLVFDPPGGTSEGFRRKIYPAYKANRGPCPEDLVPQFNLVKEAGVAFGITGFEAAGYEADDVIATLTALARGEGVDVDVLSGDKDLMQLITAPGAEPAVHMVEPTHMARLSHGDVLEKWGVPASKLGDVLALAGDAADNIPGVPGIGPKIAAALINEYGTLTAVIENAGSVKQTKRRENLIEHADKALLSRKLVTLEDSIPANEMSLPPMFRGSVADLRMEAFNSDRLLDFYDQMELVDIKRRLLNQLGSRSGRGSNGGGGRSGGPGGRRRRTTISPPKPEDYAGVPF